MKHKFWRMRLKKQMTGPKGRQRPVAMARFPRHFVDAFYMRRALKLARTAAMAGEVPVAALLVRRGCLVKAAANRVEEEHNGLAHAELLLLQWASRTYERRLTDFTLYVTLEPCIMCTGALLHARIGRLVYAADDPERGGCGSQFAIPQHAKNLHRLKITKGIFAKEAKQLLQDFFRARRAEAKARS